MANRNLPGERSATPPEETEPSWRPQDPDLPDERNRAGDDGGEPGGGGEPRDARWWDSDEPYARSAGRPSDRPGAGYRGAEASRYGEERLRELQRGPRRDERSEMRGGIDWRPSAGSFEDRYRALGPDAGIGAGPDHTGSDPWHYASQSAYRGRDFEPERYALSGSHGQRMGDAGARHWRGDERIGEPAGSYSRPGVSDTADTTSSAAREVHVHRGTGPHRGKGPAGYQRSDERIRELVCESLTDDDEIDASHIEVGVSNGEVTLSGTIDDRRTKRAAEDCAYSVSGVRDVQNRLRVRDDSASRSNPSGAAAVDPHETQRSAQGSKPRG